MTEMTQKSESHSHVCLCISCFAQVWKVFSEAASTKRACRSPRIPDSHMWSNTPALYLHVHWSDPPPLLFSLLGVIFPYSSVSLSSAVSCSAHEYKMRRPRNAHRRRSEPLAGIIRVNPCVLRSPVSPTELCSGWRGRMKATIIGC